MPTYGAVVRFTTTAASAFAASCVFAGFAPVTVSEINGVARVAPLPVAAPTSATDTFPRSAPPDSPAFPSASDWAEAESVISAIARGLE